MTKSIYTKLVAIILVLILALMAVVGAFLMQGVRNFYISEFYSRMQEVFGKADLAQDLRAAADAPDAADRLAEILWANAGNLGIDSGNRNYYILDGETGEYLVGSDPAAGRELAVTRNILTALGGSEGYASNAGDDFMDVALPIRGESGSYIVYIIDNKDTVTSLNARLFNIIIEAMAIGLVISVLLSLLLAKTMVTPIQELTHAAEKVAAGDFSETVENPAKDEIGTLTRTFNDMAGQLESNIEDLKNAEQTRREFVANVSHELRTPVTSIRSYAETLADAGGGMDPEMEKHFLDVIVGESDRMTKIVQDLLMLSKFDAGSIAFDFEEFSFEKSVTDVYNAQLLEAQSRGHNFTLEFKGAIPPIRGDRLRIEQVLTNLVSNAIKYTPEGSHIVLSAARKDDMAEVSIADDGPGISDEAKPHLFDMFYTASQGKADTRRGLGLGLNLCQSIVTAHGGTISVADNAPHGTVFRFTLPIAEVTNHGES